jgi:thioredoxin 1
MAIFEVDESDFEEIKSQELDKGHFVLLRFGSELCDACQAMEFELEELDEIRDDVSILYIDCTDSEELTEMYAIQRVPTLFIYNNQNQMIFQHEGVILCQDILEIIKK